MVWAAVASAFVSETSKSAPMPPDVFSPYQPINVAPVGVNIGEILASQNSGSAVNGGTPVNIPYDLGWNSGGATALVKAKAADSIDLLPWIVVGSVSASALYLVLRKR